MNIVEIFLRSAFIDIMVLFFSIHADSVEVNGLQEIMTSFF